MKAQDARKRFRHVLTGDACFHPASVYDPLSARLAEDAGFELGMFAGSTASLAVLAAADLIVLTLTELAEQARRICRASSLPLLVDADHGYGGALNVMRTVEELENAGIAALTIEDTVLPATFGATGKAALTSVEEGAGKMRAALQARSDAGLCIIGRTSAPQITDMADTLVRIKAYEACGVDGIFLVGVKSWEQLSDIRAAVSLPLLLGNAGTELMADRKKLAAHGVRVCLQGHQPIAAAVQALQATYKALREGTAPQAIEGLASASVMADVSRAETYAKWNGDFGGSGKPV